MSLGWTAGARATVGAGAAMSVLATAHTVVNVRSLRRASRSATRLPAISVLVPARNEAATIAACVRAVPDAYEVVVLDDESADATAERARSAGARVVAGRPVPPGWLGKPWACAQLVEHADPASRLLVLLDADVQLAPGAVAAAARLLLDSELDIVCPFPRQIAVTVAERLVQPLLQWSWLTMLPLRAAERSPRPSMTAACGQFVVVRRDALTRIGGFGAVRAAVLDDVALVRAVKASGGRGGVVDGTDLASCRMYDGWPALRDGYAKSLWSVFGSAPRAAAAMTGCALVWVVPPVAALCGSRAGLVGYLAGVLGRAVTARRTGARTVPDAFLHPVSISALGWLTARSSLLRRRGSLRWKDRPVTPAGP